MLCEHAPRVVRPVISQYRYFFLAALINLPGNAITERRRHPFLQVSAASFDRSGRS